MTVVVTTGEWDEVLVLASVPGFEELVVYTTSGHGSRFQ